MTCNNADNDLLPWSRKVELFLQKKFDTSSTTRDAQEKVEGLYRLVRLETEHIPIFTANDLFDYSEAAAGISISERRS